MYLLRTYPVVRILIFFLLGLLFHINNSYWVLVALIISIVVSLIAIYKKVKFLYNIVPWCFIYLLGNGIALINKTSSNSYLQNCESYVAQVISKPEQKPKSIKARAKVLKYFKEGKWIKTNEEVLLYFINNSHKPKFEEVFYIPKAPRDIEGPKNPEEFDYIEIDDIPAEDL